MKCLDYYDIKIITYSRVIVVLYIHSHTEYTSYKCMFDSQ